MRLLELLQPLLAAMREGSPKSTLTLERGETKRTSGKLSLIKSLPKPFSLWDCLRLEPTNPLLFKPVYTEFSVPCNHKPSAYLHRVTR